MPKITINEINATVQTPLNSTAGTPIAILGTATKGTRINPTLVRSVNEFEAYFGKSEPSSLPFGYIAAKEALQLGNPVLFTRLAQSNYAAASLTISGLEAASSVDILTAQVLSPGTEGNKYSIKIAHNTGTYTATVYYAGTMLATGSFTKGTDAEIDLITIGGVKISKIVTDDEVVWSAASEITFAGLADITPMTGGSDGIADYDTTAIDSLLTDVKDSVLKLQDTTIFDYSIITIPGLTYLKKDDVYVWHYLADLTCGTNYTSSGLVTAQDKIAIVDASKTTAISNVLSDLGLEGVEELPSLAVFYPWYSGATITNTAVRLLPPSIQYIKGFANLQSDGIPCRAVAGPVNGLLSGISDMAPKIGVLLSEELTNVCVNPICYHRNFGYFIDGNVVFNPKAASKTYKQLSIRQSINYIKKELDNLCYKLSYSVSSGITRTQFQGGATALLDGLKRDGFLYSYNVFVSEDSADIADGTLSAVVSIFPTPAVEEFVINLRIVNLENNL